MKSFRAELSRRQVIQWGGAVATLGMLTPAFGANDTCMTILYPAGPGNTFNADYYRDKHLTTIMKLYGRSIQRFELRKVPEMPGGAPQPAFAAAVNIWIADLPAFLENNKKHGKTLQDDVPNFTNTRPSIQFDKVHGMAGDARSAMKAGDSCLTILYPNGESVRWDVEKYRTGHMPLIMKLYGREAIKRFELRKGDSGMAPGEAAKYIGSVNIYIQDQKAFDAAGKAHGKTLVDDVPNFSSVMPVAFPTVIHGVA
jgi:uncharacterized protein (TIGR02118 family)